MRGTRATIALAAVGLLAGCGSDAPRESSSTTPRTGAYVAAARTSLDTPAKLASILSQRLDPTSALPDAREVRAVASELSSEIDGLRRLRIDDSDLGAQRTRLADALASLLPTMDRIGDALESGDRRALADHGNAFLDQVRSLPSRLDAS